MHTRHTRTTHRPDIVTHLSLRLGLVGQTATLTLDSSQLLPAEMAPALNSVRDIFSETLYLLFCSILC